jgi:hypothetical protein
LIGTKNFKSKKKFGYFKEDVLKINIRLGKCEDGMENVFKQLKLKIDGAF